MRMCLQSVVVPQLGQVVAPLPVDGASPTRLQVPPATEVSKSLAQLNRLRWLPARPLFSAFGSVWPNVSAFGRV
jgi:hypothetical protein